MATAASCPSEKRGGGGGALRQRAAPPATPTKGGGLPTAGPHVCVTRLKKERLCRVRSSGAPIATLSPTLSHRSAAASPHLPVFPYLAPASPRCRWTLLILFSPFPLKKKNCSGRRNPPQVRRGAPLAPLQGALRPRAGGGDGEAPGGAPPRAPHLGHRRQPRERPGPAAHPGRRRAVAPSAFFSSSSVQPSLAISLAPMGEGLLARPSTSSSTKPN